MGGVEGMGGEVVGGEGGLFAVERREAIGVGVIRGAVFGEKFGATVTGVVRVGEAIVDQEGFGGLGGLAGGEVVHDAVAMPSAAGLIISAAFGGIMPDGEESVGGFVTIALFAGAHGGVTGPIEDGGDGVLFQVGWAGFFPPGGDGEVPNGSSAHDHVAGWRAYGATEGSHVVGAFEHHALGGEAIEIGGVQR